jgi:putative tricarboxylic transport membrane protein
MLSVFGAGFLAICGWFTLFLIFIGVIVGIVFGAMPGLTGAMAFAVCLPLTFSLKSVDAMAFLCGLFIGSCSGGLISAILINIPGTISSIATTFDGHPMARNGNAGKALGLGIVSSFIGGTIGFLALFFIAPPLASIQSNLVRSNIRR